MTCESYNCTSIHNNNIPKSLLLKLYTCCCCHHSSHFFKTHMHSCSFLDVFNSLVIYSFIASLQNQSHQKCDCKVTYCQISLHCMLCGVVLQLVCLAGLQAEGQTLSFSGSLFFAWCFVHEEHQKGNNGQKHLI